MNRVDEVTKLLGLDEAIGPTIHLNGTSSESLWDSLTNAYMAIGDAIEKLKQCAPNGRDFYVNPDRQALARATRQHVTRLAALESVRDSLLRENEIIEAQVHGR